MSNNNIFNCCIGRYQNLIIPKRVTIETIFGCNADCIICPINKPTKRKKGIMNVDLFKYIIDSLIPFKESLEMMDLYCLGEPILDPYIFERIKYVKGKGFQNLGISTNADLLDYKRQKLLLESGIDTVLFSIDGIKKETHESIRRGVNYSRVIENCCSIIKLRNDGNYKTRFIVRFVQQEINMDEWERYKEFWLSVISKEKQDLLIKYDMHTWGGQMFSKDAVLKNNERDAEIEKQPCNTIFDILYILRDGSVPLCHEDWLHPEYNFGNVTNNNPVEIFNSEYFNRIREIHLNGERNNINICNECTAIYSLANKIIF